MGIQKVSILGCGWLGFPLATELHKMGYKVKGSTTTQAKLKNLLEEGIDPYFVNLTPILQATDIHGFMGADVIIVNIPPGTRTKSAMFHIEQMQHLLPYLQNSSAKRILYVSSTSVYPDLNREMNETDVQEELQTANKTLFTAERLMQSLKGKEVTILRCGGLTGYDRLLIRHFAGRKGLTIGEEPVNLVHRDDVIAVISAILKQEKWGEVFNVCSPEHPTKKEFYMDLAKRYNFEAPEFVSSENQKFKIINSQKLVQALNYSFIYPNPMKFTYI